MPVHAVGKVGDLFAGEGIDEVHPGATNARALRETSRLVDELDRGLVFTNLIETLLACFAGHGGRRHDGEPADVGASVLRWLAGREAPGLPGRTFA